MERITGKQTWAEARKNLGREPGYSHIWTRLNLLEDILGDTYDPAELGRLLDASRAGLVRIVRPPDPGLACCGNCAHFRRLVGSPAGGCAARDNTRRYYQSKRACSLYQGRRAGADQ